MKPSRILAAGIAACMAIAAGAAPRHSAFHETDTTYFKSAEAAAIGEQILAYQRCTGGWPKNTGLGYPKDEATIAKERANFNRKNDSTIDNNATTMEMKFLARLNQMQPDARYREAFARGLDFLLSGQYPEGGWPQFWPDPQGYQVHVTYNDNAIYNTLDLFRRIVYGEAPFAQMVDEPMRARLAESLERGVDVILATQIKVDGKPTVWCQQHDRDTYLPAKARSYELPSFCSYESAMLMELLMALPAPDARITASLDGAAQWLDAHKITGKRVVRDHDAEGNTTDVRLADDPTAPELWARFYDLEKGEPYVCDRDGVPRRDLSEIGLERRSGYGWYDTRTGETMARYREWKAAH